MEELVEEDEMTEELKVLSKLDFQPSCFFTGFNGPIDPGFALIAHANSSDPLTLIQARKRPDWTMWEAAIQVELKALEAFSTFELVNLPPGKKPVGCKYVFKIKYKPDGGVEKYKVRLVAQGFLQQEGIDYNEVFAPVVDSTSISLLLAIANHEDWEMEQMDVVTAFLHGRLEEEVYMQIPPYMNVPNPEGKVLKLKGALYGLKQSSHVWGKTFEAFMIRSGFKQMVMDTCIYTRGTGQSRIILAIHVDDQAIVGPNKMVIAKFKEELAAEFKMKDLGALTHILGVEVMRDRRNKILTLHQSSYVRQVLERYGMQDCNPTKLPMTSHLSFTPDDEPMEPPDPQTISEFRAKVGSLIYAMKQTRIDICYPLGVLAKHMSNPGPAHIKALHQLLRYLKGTQDYGLTYVGKKKFEVRGYCDASYNCCRFSSKSVTGWVTTVGGTALSWKSQKQSTVAQSTAEAEYIAACSVSKECCYLKTILKELGFPVKIRIYCDSEAAIAMIENPVQRQKTRHFEVVYHFVRQCHRRKRLSYEFLSGYLQPADLFTKPLPFVTLARHLKTIGFGRVY